jgi:hypothetical protein
MSGVQAEVQHMGDPGDGISGLPGFEKDAGLDAKWTHRDPYPSWPFGRVRPRELAKWIKANNPVEEALL